MIVTYTPDGGDRQEWEWNPDKVRAVEGELIEKRFGDTYDKFKVAVQSGSIKARRVLLWHLLKRAHPTLRHEDLDFEASELKVEMTRGELELMKSRVAKAKGMDEATREQMLGALDSEIEEAPAGDTEGKALSKPSSDATGLPSPS
ncbi:hypothetical protein [Lentzea albida]|uniref:Uncharacterized protein n=1 Tax=Lentzea albida TaxID=65499 RepID=A0A1H9VH69_9PSEU|nr:hypothetical protein [Lentzea albida]SES20881.1 hypothetical protein SAMN04488000_118111 [Lentzea albida]